MEGGEEGEEGVRRDWEGEGEGEEGGMTVLAVWRMGLVSGRKGEVC